MGLAAVVPVARCVPDAVCWVCEAVRGRREGHGVRVRVRAVLVGRTSRAGELARLLALDGLAA